MARKLYISDCHFFHRALLHSMDNRGFATVEEMNEHMIRQWNAAVGPRDEVYILGDFSYGKAPETAGVIRRLRGKLYLIIGNHDNFIKKMDEETKERFGWITHYREIRDDGCHVILSHYPTFCYNGQYHFSEGQPSGVYMLYGHVHDTLDERLVNRFIRETRQTAVTRADGSTVNLPCQMINCFTMFADYQPKTLDQWIAIDAARRAKLDGMEENT